MARRNSGLYCPDPDSAHAFQAITLAAISGITAPDNSVAKVTGTPSSRVLSAKRTPVHLGSPPMPPDGNREQDHADEGGD